MMSKGLISAVSFLNEVMDILLGWSAGFSLQEEASVPSSGSGTFDGGLIKILGDSRRLV